MWHFGFGGQDMERLVAGRERIYLDRFWNELSRDQKRFDEAKRQHYAALYAQPGAMRAGFAQFLAFSQDAADNRTFLAQASVRCRSWPSVAKLHSALCSARLCGVSPTTSK